MMLWYEGDIAEAITTSKNKGAVFVVYIEGKDDKSTEITSVIDNPEVSAQLGGDQFVAIKIEADSVPHQQFSQFYKATPIPSIYFIGKTGVPIEIVTEVKDPQSILMTLGSILQKAGISVKSSQSSADFIAGEQSSSAPPPNAVCENGACTIKKDVPSTNQDAKASPSSDDKVKRAKQIIDLKRAQKQKEEEEKERQKEIERRKMGQNVQQLKRWQEDQDMKQVLEERERDRRESQAARDRVLAQIAQDKAERASKFSPSQQEHPQTSTHQPSPRPATNANIARIQFRLPDGSTSNQDFTSSDTLEAVHTHIRTNMNLPFANYTLSTTFPRREFTDSDRNQSLIDLELVPTAVILIIPLSRGAISTNPNGGFIDMIWYLLTPLMSVLGFLKTFIFGTAPADSLPGTSENANKRPHDTKNEPPRVVIKKRTGETTVVKRQGNIHRLSNNTDSDDENNTWNGNSTQQM